MKTYTLENKPKFKYNDKVSIDMAFFGTDLGILPGRIVGRGAENVIDLWLVEFRHEFESYPFPVLTVPHVAILDI